MTDATAVETRHDSDDMPAMNPAKPAHGGRGPDGKINRDCEGFELAGLKYSPGGKVLPNKCAEFDALTNNPYAVRCIDVMSN